MKFRRSKAQYPGVATVEVPLHVVTGERGALTWSPLVGMEAHSPVPHHDGDTRHDGCQFLDGVPCYSAVGPGTRINPGPDDAVFGAIEAEYADWFPGGAE